MQQKFKRLTCRRIKQNAPKISEGGPCGPVVKRVDISLTCLII